MFLAPVVVATLVGDKVVVNEVDGKAVKQLYAVDATRQPRFAFTDAHTLWVAVRDGDAAKVTEYVDGTFTTSRVFPTDLFQKTLYGRGNSVYHIALVVADGHPYAGECTAGEDARACRVTYVRADLDPMVTPAQEHPAANLPDELGPLSAPPHGYAATVSKDAVTCTGGKRFKLAIPVGTTVAAIWRTERPAILDIELRSALPAPLPPQSLDLQYTGWGEPQHVFVESCATKLDAVYSLPGALWATEQGGKTTLRQADKTLAVVPGIHAAVAP